VGAPQKIVRTGIGGLDPRWRDIWCIGDDGA